MIAAMDWFTAPPLVLLAIVNLGTFAMHALAERLLTIGLVVFVVGGVTLFALAGFAWLWIKHVFAELHLRPSTLQS